MQTLVDFKGYRIVALPLLPIDKNTIVYGSADAGVTVHNSEQLVSEYMKKAGEEMHLAGHKVGSCVLYSAGDVEVHRSKDEDAKDQYFYLLDLARCFPPESIEVVAWMSEYKLERADAIESENQIKVERLEKMVEKYCVTNASWVFHRMLRPEALLRWKKSQEGTNRPLSSDAFTHWSSLDENAEAQDMAVADATLFIFETQMLLLANDLLQRFGHIPMEQLWNINLAESFHNYGVNMRHIGCVAEECRSLILQGKYPQAYESVVQRLSAEILFRTLKNAMRDVLRKAKQNTDSALKHEVAGFINNSLADFNHIVFNFEKLRLEKGSVIQRVERNYGTVAIRILLIYVKFWRFDIGKIFLKVFKRCGIEVEQEIQKALSLGLSQLTTIQDLFVHPSEIISFSSNVKKMAFFDFIHATDITTYAEQSEVMSFIDRSTRLRKVAIKSLNQSLVKFPSSDKLRNLVVEQIAGLFMPSQFWACKVNGFEEPPQKSIFCTYDEFVDLAVQIRRHGNHQGLQLVISLLEILLFPKRNWKLVPDFLNIDLKGPFEIPGIHMEKLVLKDFEKSEIFDTSEEECDVSIVEYLMFVQLLRMELKRRGKSFKDLNWEEKARFFDKYGTRYVKKFNSQSPEEALGWAVHHNTYLGYAGMEPGSQIEMTEQFRKVCSLNYSPVLKYFHRFCKLPPRLAFLSMLFPSDFGDILMKDILMNTHVLKL
jgi:hypothetical protein